jgi:chaperone modulatory protein CbpM
MIMLTHEFILQTRIDIEDLDKWIAEGWLIPGQTGASRDYSAVDLARAYFIRDLQDLGVNDEGIPIVLDLVDQLHGVRRVLREVLAEFRTEKRSHA